MSMPGTDIPSNFSSKIHLRDPARGEDRDVLIRMNSPLRYGGETYYQASFEPGDQVSILQVVRNPAAVTPYVACLLDRRRAWSRNSSRICLALPEKRRANGAVPAAGASAAKRLAQPVAGRRKE